jgi:large subunit ribosomal protein L19
METTIKFTPVNVEARKKIQFKAGDTVRVKVKIQEKGKVRLQTFEGLVIARKHGHEAGATFTVRKVSNGVGVERIFPLYSPILESIELVKKSKTRQSKLYFLREKTAKEVRRKLKSFAVFFTEKELEIPEEDMEEEVEEEATETSVKEVTAEEAAEEKEEEVSVESPKEEEKTEEETKG